MRTLMLACLFLVSADAAAQTTAYVGARLFDGDRVIERATLVVRDGRVAAVGPAADVRVPEGAARVDVGGKTIVPGFINAHGHVGNTVGLRADPAGYTRDNLIRQLRSYAQYGVTTVYSLGDDGAAGFALRDEQGRGPLDRARLFVAGPVITGATADEARAMTDEVADRGPDLLKIRIDDNLGTSRKMPEDAWRAVVARARERQLRVATHIFYLADAHAALEAGSDFIAHSVRDVPVTPAFVAAMKARNACYSPTLMREVSTFVYGETPAWNDDPFFVKGVDAAIRAELASPARHEQVRKSGAWKLGQQYKAGLDVARRNLKALADAGVRIAFGTDTGPPGRFQGFFEHLELELMVDAGLTPLQALRSATSVAAGCHGKIGELGTLAPGAAADFLVLGANPLADIRNTRSLEAVYIGGRKAF
ncbi:MAG: amidohydrolase family protein [Acidobacteriota bacterium]